MPTPEQKLADMLADAEHDYRTTAGNLADTMRNLAEQMERSAETADAIARADRDDTHGTGISSLGEIQGRGMDVDRRCAELAFRLETLKRLRYVAKVADDA